MEGGGGGEGGGGEVEERRGKSATIRWRIEGSVLKVTAHCSATIIFSSKPEEPRCHSNRWNILSFFFAHFFKSLYILTSVITLCRKGTYD